MNRPALLSLLFAVLIAGCGAPSGSVPQAATLVAQAAETATAPTTASPTESPTPTPTEAPAHEGIARLPVGAPVSISSIRMFDTSNGWAVGGPNGEHVLLTADGGDTWRDVTPPEAPPPAETPKAAVAHFEDSSTAWVTYYFTDLFTQPDSPVVWRTFDGGQSWTPSAPLDLGNAAEFYQPTDLTFANATNGWLLVHVGAGMHHDYVMLFHTTDGGGSWERLLDPFNDPSDIQGCQKTGLAFADPASGWMTVDCQGVVPGMDLLRTTDGGQTWTQVSLPPPADHPNLYDTNFCGAHSPRLFRPDAGLIGVTCVDMNDIALQVNWIYVSSDAGGTWDTRAYPEGRLLFLDAGTGWAIGRTIYRSLDGGGAWEQMTRVAWDGRFSFINESNGWAAVSSDEGTALVRTEDGGRTYALLQPVVAP